MEEQAKIEYQAGRLTASVALLMPEIGGAELATEIQSDSVLQHVRIVFLTAIVSSKAAFINKGSTSSRELV